VPADHQYPSGPSRVTVQIGRDLPRASGADAVRTMVDGSTQGTLSTLAVDPAGFPFGSIVSFAPDADGDPLFVISQLAEHTRNLTVDPRASLLVAEPAPDGDRTADPLARGRVTLIGEARIVPDEQQAAAVGVVAARIPAVAGYAGYGDFACYRLEVLAIRWVGGFGAMDWIDVEAYRHATVDPVLPRRHGIAQHMDEDHAEAGILLCQQALVAADRSTTRTVTTATMRHVDRFGCEYVADLDDGALGIIRLGFSAPAASADDVRRLVVELVHQAREA
jgi:putative heme iron utilization protein